MNHKGNTWLIIGISIFVIVIIVFFVTILFVKFPHQNNSEQNLVVSLFLNAKDKETQIPLKVNYIIESKNKELVTKISEGLLEDSWNELKVPKEDVLIITCWSDEYYSTKIEKPISTLSITNNKTFLTCEMDKIGQIEMSNIGNLNNIDNQMDYSITTLDNFKKLALCFSWTAGIISVNSNYNFLYCDEGVWDNYTLDANNKKVWLSNRTYLCGSDFKSECEYVNGKNCNKIGDKQIEPRYKGKVDKCFYTGNSIKNGTYNFQVSVKTDEFKNSFDELKVFVFDFDRRYVNNQWVWTSENIGFDDVEYNIKYNAIL